jgi:glycosyltransferase involved in cell wall biosynthesis
MESTQRVVLKRLDPAHTPLVSVIMPVYNAGEYLRPAVQSVIDQTLTDWELIIVDDGSTDGAVDAISAIGDPRIRITRQENRGKPVAMNRALAQARGTYYALQDADDISHPTRLDRQARCLNANPDVAGVFCCNDVIVDGRTLAPTFHAKSPEECARNIADERMPGHDPTAMYRLSMVREFDYAEDLPTVEGVDYVLRVGERYPLMVLGECLYSYRLHPGSVTHSNTERRVAMREQAIARVRQRRGKPYTEADRRATLRRLTKTLTEDNDIVSHFSTSVAGLVRLGRRREAIQIGLTSLRRSWRDPYYAKPFVYALMPMGAVRMYKSARRRLFGR